MMYYNILLHIVSYYFLISYNIILYASLLLNYTYASGDVFSVWENVLYI